MHHIKLEKKKYNILNNTEIILDGRIEYRDIKWNEKTKRWNKGCSYYFASVGRRYYDLDPSLNN